jgi:acyl-CoA reductase-like NAD-dependent aldehyde dehydrogenase
MTAALDFAEFFIGGRWLPPAEKGPVAIVHDSATEEVFGSVPLGTPTDVDRAVDAARQAFDDWATTPAKERASYLYAIADSIETRTDEFAEVITRETGCTLAVSRSVQVGNPVEFTRIAAGEAEAGDHGLEIGHSLVVREPIGVVGCIGPWNYPLNQIVKKAMFAIAAGCTVVVKPSEIAPLDVFLLADIADQAGLPAGVLNVVCGYGEVVGEAISGHPGVDMVSFTGSTRAGRRVAEVAAGTVKKVTLELGGKSPLVILDDLDDDTFARAVAGGVTALMMNGGQTCAALTRMVVPRTRLAEAERIAATAAADVVVGDPFRPGVALGPLASAQHRDRVAGYIRTGVEEGARLLAGGQDAPPGLHTGYYVRPTVFSNVDNGMRIAREEIFGPVQVLIAHDGVDDAIRIANESDYGLSGGVWAADLDVAMKVAGKLRTGSVRVNGAAPNVRAPFGGYKQSGVGREYGRFGYEEFLEVKSIHRPPTS